MNRATLVLVMFFASACAMHAQPYNVKDYGAVCDKITDDTAAFSGALAAARMHPGKIIIPAGTCSVASGVITIDTPGVTLSGQGIGASVINILTSGDAIRFGADGVNFPDCGGIEHLSITSGSRRAAGRAIVVSGCSGGRIRDIKLDHVTGHGIVFTCEADHTLNSACDGEWFVEEVRIEHSGPYAAVWVESDSDRHFTDIKIRGDRSAGSRGVLILRTGGDWFRDLTTVFEEIGVSLEPPTGKTIQFLHFANVYADSGLDSGWRFSATGGAIRGVDCEACWAGGNGIPVPLHPEFPAGNGTASYGFKIRNGDGLVFRGARIWDNGGIGLEVGPQARNVQIMGGWASSNSAAAPGVLPAYRLAGWHIMLSLVNSGDVVYANPWQSCAVEVVAGADRLMVVNNDFGTGNVTPICNPLAPSDTRIFANNL